MKHSKPAGLAAIARSATAAAFFCVSFATAALAQSEPSTWQHIIDTKTLRVGLSPTEPYGFKDVTGSALPGGVKVGGDVWRGIVPLVAQELAEGMGVKLQVVETTYQNAIAGLQAGQFDFFAPLNVTPKRAMAVDFAPAPMFWFAMSVHSRNPLPADITWDALNDPKYKIGVVLGAQTDIFAGQIVPKATISRFQDSDQQIAALQAGRVDMIVGLSTVTMVARAKLKFGYLAYPKPEKPFAAQIGIRRESDQRWRNYLSTVVQFLYDTGESQNFLNSYLAYRGIDAKDSLPAAKEEWK